MQKTEAEKLFLDKMAVLNKTFLHFIECSLKEMPDADLSPSVRDYLKHVEELDRTYGGVIATNCNGSSKTDDSDGDGDGDGGGGGGGGDSSNNTKIAVVVIDDTTEKTATVSKTNPPESGTNEPVGTNPKINPPDPKPSSNTVPSLLNTNTVTPAAASMVAVPKISFDDSKSSNVSGGGDSEKRGRKRAKRGGPEGGDDEVIISNHNTPTSTRYVTDAEGQPNKTLSTQSATSPKASSFLNNLATGNILNINFTSTNVSKTDTLKGITEKNDTADADADTAAAKIEGSADSKSIVFSFGSKTDSTAESEKKSPQSAAFVFDELPSKVGTTEPVAENVAKQSPPPAKLPITSNVTPVFSFLKPSETATKNGPDDVEASDSSKSALGFKFAAPPVVQSESNNEGDEAEYVPPKPEAVITDEPNAIFSSKCSVFVLKAKEYEKLGVGQLHIKKSETDSEKKILLIRAATTIGTVWVNSYIDDTMKSVKVEETKLRVSCVSGNGTPSTYLIRLPKLADREKVAEELSMEKEK